MFEFLGSEDLSSVITIITALMTLLGGIAVRFLAQITPVIKEKTKNQSLNIVIDTVAKFVEFVVRDLNQTMVWDIKEAADDGKLTKAEQEAIKKKATIAVLDNLNESTTTLLKDMVGDVEKFIQLLIESKVDEIKKTN